MVYIGAVIGAGLAHGKNAYLYKKVKLQTPGTWLLRYDVYTHFFASIGAAAGFAVIFGSPLGKNKYFFLSCATTSSIC
jgi:hypothetical protein